MTLYDPRYSAPDDYSERGTPFDEFEWGSSEEALEFFNRMSSKSTRAAQEPKLTVADLSVDQLQALEQIYDWAVDDRSPLLTLGGFAGTGKSTLLGVFARQVPIDPIAFCSYTGKASNVLARKLAESGVATTRDLHCVFRVEGGEIVEAGPPLHGGDPYCGTIHGLIYRPIIDEETGAVIDYQLRDELDRQYGLIIADEASMISDDILKHLQWFNIPILAVGDHGQLMPVSGAGSLMADPDIKLEKIHRQAESNPIIQLSKAIRETGKLDRRFADNTHVFFGQRRETEKHLKSRYSNIQEKQLFDIATICHTNATRIMLNVLSRQSRGFMGAPKIGEQLLCLKNDRKTGVFNGMRGVLDTPFAGGDMKYPWRYRGDVRFPEDDNMRAAVTMFIYQFNRKGTYNSLDDVFNENKSVNVRSWEALGNLWDFGYALTCHKCVAPETLVETPVGLIEIQHLSSTGRIATPTGQAAYHGLTVNPVSRMLEIETVDGYKLRVTPNHGVDCWEPDSGYVRVEARALCTGDFVRLRLGNEFNSRENRCLPGGREPDVRAKIYELPALCHEAFAEFLGMMVADGTIYRSGFRLAKRHEDVADRFDYLCRTLFGVTPSRFFTLNAHHVEVNSTYIRDWLECIGGLEPNAKRIPQCILASSMPAQARFLRGLFEDGTVNVRQDGVLDHIEFGSCEDSVRQTVRTMLLRWGIVCGASRRETSVYIYGQHTKRFGDAIGFVSKMKRERLKALTAEGTRYVFPLTSDERRILGREDRIQRHLIKKLDSSLQHGFGDRIGFHHSEISEIRPYRGTSVCVEVPAGHRFLQNGFCGWNSQGSQFDDVLLIIEGQGRMSDDEYRSWAYTAATRSSNKLTILT
jgi:exodeoxyribonuclease-5